MFRRLTGCAVVIGVLLVPAVASASLPLVATDGATATGTTTARIEGNADPSGQKTMLWADYALASSKWCTTGGTKGKAARTAPINLGSGNVMFSEILVALTGLAPNERYCAELVAHNRSGTAHGGQLSFMTPSE